MELGLEGIPLKEVLPPDELFDKERLEFSYNSAREAVLRELDRQPEGMCFAEARIEAEEVRRVLRIARRQLRHQRGRNLALLGRCSPDAAARGRAAGEEVRALRRKLASLDAEAQELSAEVEAAENGHEIVVDELEAIRDEMERWRSAVESLEDGHAAASALTPPPEPAPPRAPASEPASPPGRRGEPEAKGNFRLALDRTSLLKGQQQPRPEAPARAQSGGGSYLPPGSATPVRAVSAVVQLSGLSTPVQTVVVSARSPGSASPLPACRLSCGSLLGNVTPLQASARNTRSTGSASPSLESSPLNSYRIGASASAAGLPGQPAARSATPLQPAMAPTRCLQPSQSCGSVHLVCSRASSPRQLTSAPLPQPAPPLPSPQQGGPPRGCPQPLLSPPRARAAPAQAPPTPPIAGVGRGIWQMTAQQPLM